MGIFSRGDEFIDYTLLKRKGLLKVPEIKEEVLDFTQGNNETKTQGSTPAFGDFFGTSSSSSDSGSGINTDVPNPFSGLDSPSPGGLGGLPMPSMPSPSSDDLKEMNALKIKLDDLEYKLERLLERLGKLEGEN